MCGLLCLASVTQHDVLDIYPLGSRYQYFTPLHGGLIFHCVNIPQCVKHSSTGGHVGCFHLWAVVNTAAMNVQVSV